MLMNQPQRKIGQSCPNGKSTSRFGCQYASEGRILRIRTPLPHTGNTPGFKGKYRFVFVVNLSRILSKVHLNFQQLRRRASALLHI